MISRFKSGPRMSQVVVHANMVYIAGQVADDLNANVASQTREVLAKIDALLAEAGTDKGNILMTTVYLADIATFNEMNAVWDAWVVRGKAPARATIGCQPAAPGYRVEMVVTAATGT
jgi:enamine deaminase RidA (YjgF/YER057c/UK114 family)